MADDSDKSSGQGSSPPPAPDRGQDGVNLSIEERGMVVMPQTPDPQMNVQIGGLPTAEGSGGGEGGGSSSGGGSEGGGGGSSSGSGGE
jgi:hypothetical protein